MGDPIKYGRSGNPILKSQWNLNFETFDQLNLNFQTFE